MHVYVRSNRDSIQSIQHSWRPQTLETKLRVGLDYWNLGLMISSTVYNQRLWGFVWEKFPRLPWEFKKAEILRGDINKSPLNLTQFTWILYHVEWGSWILVPCRGQSTSVLFLQRSAHTLLTVPRIFHLTCIFVFQRMLTLRMKRCQKRMFIEDAQGSEDGEHLERGTKNDRLGGHPRRDQSQLIATPKIALPITNNTTLRLPRRPLGIIPKLPKQSRQLLCRRRSIEL